MHIKSIGWQCVVVARVTVCYKIQFAIHVPANIWKCDAIPETVVIQVCPFSRTIYFLFTLLVAKIHVERGQLKIFALTTPIMLSCLKRHFATNK